jgi:hypothetical protein
MPYGIEEALTAVTAGALVQKWIDPLVDELQRRYAPLMQAIPSKQINSTVFNWDIRTQLPSGGFVTDGGGRPVSKSKYTQKPVTMQHLLTTGAVTGYAEAVTATFGSLRGREIVGAIQNQGWLAETGLMFGNAAATAGGAFPEWDGLDTLVNSATNTVTLAGATFTLAQFDQVIDLVENNIAENVFNQDWMFVVSPGIDSKIAQISTQYQRFIAPMMEVGVGLIVPSYRNIPIVKTSLLGKKAGTMGAITLAQTSTGGHIAASTTRKYRLSAIIPTYGETAPCAEVSIAVSAGTTTNIVTISFTPPTTPTGGPVWLYKVWESATAGTERLLGVVDGTVGQSGLNPITTTSIVDTGTALVPHHGSTVPATTPAAYVGGNATLKCQVATGQDFYLISRKPANIVRPYVRDCQPVPNLAPTVTGPDQLPYALITDTALAVRMNTFIGRGRSTKTNLS